MAPEVRCRPSEALEQHREAIRDAIARRRGSDVLVFGSTARGDDTIDSDLDLMVTVEPRSIDLADLFDLTAELEAITGVRVQVVSGRGAGAVLDRARREVVPL